MRRPRRRVRTVARGWIGFAVAGRTRQPPRPVAVGTASPRHRMRQAGVELQRSIAGDMAVLAPRMLEYLLDGGEGRDRLDVLFGVGLAAGGRRERHRGGDQHRAPGYPPHALSRNRSSPRPRPGAPAPALAPPRAIRGT